MADQGNKVLDTFCTTLEMKEKMRALYDDAMKNCPDQVGVETFKMLRDAEVDHLKRVQEVFEQMKKGGAGPDACKFHQMDTPDKKSMLRKVAAEHGKLPKACLDDVAAIEIGLSLENSSITYYTDQLKSATDATERQVLNDMIREEREHYNLLADLKFYYVDPEMWFLEKGGNVLDGAGAMT